MANVIPNIQTPNVLGFEQLNLAKRDEQRGIADKQKLQGILAQMSGDPDSLQNALMMGGFPDEALKVQQGQQRQQQLEQGRATGERAERADKRSEQAHGVDMAEKRIELGQRAWGHMAETTGLLTDAITGVVTEEEIKRNWDMMLGLFENDPTWEAISEESKALGMPQGPFSQMVPPDVIERLKKEGPTEENIQYVKDLNETAAAMGQLGQEDYKARPAASIQYADAMREADAAGDKARKGYLREGRFSGKERERDLIMADTGLDIMETIAFRDGLAKQGYTLDRETGEFKNQAGVVASAAELEGAKEDAIQEAQKKAIKGKKEEELMAKRIEEAPGAFDTSEYSYSNLQAMEEQAAILIDHPGFEDAIGFGGELRSNLTPGSEAANFAGLLQTMKAKTFTAAIQSMREASKSGGAVGAVNEAELENFQNQYTSLLQSQSSTQFKKELERLLVIVKRGKRRVRRAYQRTYKDVKGAPDWDKEMEYIYGDKSTSLPDKPKSGALNTLEAAELKALKEQYGK